MVSKEQIRALYEYSPDTGEFVFKPRDRSAFATERAFRVFQSKSLGRVAGWTHTLGYTVINVDGKPVLAHRMAWLWMTGELPPEDIDHINGDRSDNRFTNLRPVTRAENNRNFSLPARNRTGVIGVMWDKRRRAWRAEIKDRNRLIYLGQFKTIEEASAARKGAERVLGYHQGHGKKPVADYRYAPKKPRRLTTSPDVQALHKQPAKSS